MNRREALKMSGLGLLGGAFTTLLGNGCSPVSSQAILSGGTTNAADPLTGQSCSLIPAETEGPYPAHDDSAVNCLSLSGILRSDIRASLNSGAYTGTATAAGVPMNITLTLQNLADNCAPLEGYIVYIWHCDAAGRYSMYTSSVVRETFLRGLQQADANGRVTFQTIVPGCYEGRYPHIHFEMFPSLAQAVDKDYVMRTSQLTFPQSMLDATYALSSYSGSRSAYSRVSLSSDGIFRDGATNQIVTIDSGDTTSGYNVRMNVGINP